jgi:hypothetical protein
MKQKGMNLLLETIQMEKNGLQNPAKAPLKYNK